MANCIKCGGMLDSLDAGGDMICQNCESAVIGGASGSSVPCQRCGMYLPRHELRMYNSRLYCAYCIMDLQDEDRRIRGGGRGFGGEGGRIRGICERCGRETDTLYTVQGRNLCSSCHSTGSGAGDSGGPSILGIIVEKIVSSLGVRQPLKIIKVPPPAKIGIKTGKSATDDKERQRKSQERFDLKERRMMKEEEGQLGTKDPLSEGHRKEKKPSPEARKKFFSQHGGEKK